MSKTENLAQHLEKLHINNMYKNDFYWTWDKTGDELDAIFTVADALRDLRERNISTKIFDSGLGISIFRDNSTRTRFSFASACNLLGLDIKDLDEKTSQIAHGETVRETANMVSFMADVVGIRDLKEAINYIEQNFQNNITIEDIASVCGINRSYFGKIFLKSVGKSPQEFLINYRMVKAAELLKLTSLSIADISSAVGYENQLHFSRAFKTIYGVSPRNWRNQNK